MVQIRSATARLTCKSNMELVLISTDPLRQLPVSLNVACLKCLNMYVDLPHIGSFLCLHSKGH